MKVSGLNSIRLQKIFSEDKNLFSELKRVKLMLSSILRFVLVGSF